jgi:GTPase Era involved in 16S rRNA processing
MIAVMGDTSSGKSSLLSSIALVELPSSSELTTRCPIVLNMSKGNIRSAIVSVKSCELNARNTKIAVYSPKTIVNENWATLPSVISDAQKYNTSNCTSSVSRDMVVVKVVGPDYEDLTVVDLPGIVRSHGKDESQTLSQEIEVLIGDYLKNERCVILAVVPANVDFHNNQILSDAQKVDPMTKRTIPVITKPDAIDPGAEMEVLDLLQGKKMEFELGFHMTKGRGQIALNNKQSIKEALNDEEIFFRSKEPWRSMTDRSVFGIPNLRSKLSDLQVRIIRSSIPGILKEVNEKREKSLKEFGLLGEPLTTIKTVNSSVKRLVNFPYCLL